MNIQKQISESVSKPDEDGLFPQIADYMVAKKQSGSASLLNMAQTQSKPKVKAEFDPEDDYDFDQDEDTSSSVTSWAMIPKSLKQSDVIKGYYRRVCAKDNVQPLARFIDQIGQDEITLRNMGFSRRGFKAICACSIYMMNLKSLDFTGNNLGRIEISYLCQFLKETSNVVDLVLGGNCINGITLQILTHFGTGRILHKLDLSNNKMNDDDGQCIADMIEHNVHIRELYLHKNEFRENGAVRIAKALEENRTLNVLDLSWNHIRGVGAVALANAIYKNTNLDTFNVAWNGFGFDGCRAMGHALRYNTTLTELDLSNNRIHPPALFNFMGDFLHNRTLLKLKLAYNPIPAYYTFPLLSLIAKNKDMPLNLLDMSGAVVGEEFETLVAELKQERELTVLYERCLPIHRQKWAQLLKDEANTEPKVINVDPIRVLYLLKQNLRCIDMLLKMDGDRSFDLTRQEIEKALVEHKLPVSSSALDMIMGYLDTNNDGVVDLSELIGGERRYHREMIARQERQKNGPGKTATQHHLSQSVDMERFSQTYANSGMIEGLEDSIRNVMERTKTSEIDVKDRAMVGLTDQVDSKLVSESDNLKLPAI